MYKKKIYIYIYITAYCVNNDIGTNKRRLQFLMWHLKSGTTDYTTQKIILISMNAYAWDHSLVLQWILQAIGKLSALRSLEKYQKRVTQK